MSNNSVKFLLNFQETDYKGSKSKDSIVKNICEGKLCIRHFSTFEIYTSFCSNLKFNF